MHAYGFTLKDNEVDNRQYYFICESRVKKHTIEKQKETIDAVNNEVKKRFGMTEVSKSHNQLQLTVPYGTVLDSDYEVLYSPEVTQTRVKLTETAERYSVVDGTFINLYRINNQVMLGTRNSWSITNSHDIYEGYSYGEAFNDCLDHLNINVEDLPNGSYVFCNPSIHMMANDYALYSFTNPRLTINGTVYNLRFPDVSETATEYIEFYPSENAYYECVSREREELCRILYSNRNVHRCENSDHVSLLNCFVTYLCVANKSVKEYVYLNKVFNGIAMRCLGFIRGKTEEFIGISRDSPTFYGVDIPTTMNRGKVQLFPRYIDRFWKKVMENAFHNYCIKREDFPFSVYPTH